MNQGKELYAFIKSLSKAEQRYFKRLVQFGSGKTTTNTTIIFDLLNGLEEWDEQVYLSKIPASIPPNRLAVIHTRLFERLIQSLRLTQDNHLVDLQLRRFCSDIEILIDRKLYQSATKRLRKAIKLAKSFERKAMLLELFRLEYRLQLNFDGLTKGQYVWDRLQERIQTAEELARLTQAEVIDARIKLSFRNKSRKKPIPLAQSHDSNPPFPNPNSEFRAWSLQKRGVAMQHYSKGEAREALNIYDELLSTWEKKRKWIDQHPIEFFGILKNFLGLSLFLEDFEAFRSKLQEYQTLKFRTPDLQERFMLILYSKELNYAINHLDFSDAIKVTEKVGKWLGEVSFISMAQRLSTTYNILTFLFVNGEFKKANRWLLEILNASGKTERQDIRDFARVFQIVFQTELNNPDLQEYLLRSSYRYLKRKSGYQDLEKLLIQFFRRHHKLSPGSNETHRSWQTLSLDLEQLRQSRSDQHLLGLNEIAYWVQSKIEGVSIREYFERMKREIYNPKS